MSAMKFRKGMIDSVGHNSVPLSYFSKPAFQSLNGEMAWKARILWIETEISTEQEWEQMKIPVTQLPQTVALNKLKSRDEPEWRCWPGVAPDQKCVSTRLSEVIRQ